MEIQHTNNDKKGYFEAILENKKAGKMDYTWAGDSKFIIDHTEVNEGFSGQGVGKKMVLAAVDYARANNFKIIPLCPFAKATFDKTEQIRDVLF